ncbi:MAG: hypothetical protein ACREDH_05310 [Methylocella sp.]
MRGSAITDLSRVITVCDVFSALVERRAYKAPKTSERALSILMGMAKDGKMELEIVDALESCFSS